MKREIMPPAVNQIAKILALSRRRRREYAKLTAEQKRRVATKDLRALGILTKRGRLAPTFR